MAGLPGDLDSDRSYQNQLRAWIDLALTKERVGQVLVLCDNPGSLGAKRDGTVEVLKGDRSGFLALGQRVAEATNGLTMIVWGHGGKQGSVPVFHVRGPRLTTQDFKAVADRAPGGSHWLLLFRGSGAFARELAGEGRDIISSEYDSMFSSDPIGMGLMLKLAANQREASLADLAQAFGKAVSSWYEERTLARTEEPTLWFGSKPPRRLAPEEVRVAESDGSKTNAPAVAAVPGPPPAKPAELPPAWKDIQTVNPKDYPEADGVVLRKRLSYTLGSNPAIASEQEEFIQVLTVEGKRLGDFDVEYAPPAEEVSFQECEVLKPGGELVRLDPDAVREDRDSSLGDYQAARRKFFSLPGVAPGAVLHVRYRTEWAKFPLPQVSMPIVLGSDLPVREAMVEVSVPKTVSFHFALEDVKNVEPQTTESDYARIYTWNFHELPAPAREALTAPDAEPRLLISTFADWKAFAEWYGRISQLTDEVTPEIEQRAAALVEGMNDPRERVRALYEYVTALRYVAVPLGINTVRPHAAASVLEHQYGDCKDKANLFNALLHALKIEAHLVLVPRFSQALEAVPGLAFNHAISCVKLDGETIWADTTDDICRFGLLPPGDSGRNVLVIDGASPGLSALPQPSAKDHRLSIRGSLDCSRPQEPLPATLTATAFGCCDYDFRTAARASKEHGREVPLLSLRYRPAAGTLALDQQSSTSLSSLGQDFNWQGQGTFVGLAAQAGPKWLLRAPFWLPREWDLALHHRQAALFFNQGYPLMLDQEFEVTLPASAQNVELPAKAESSGAPLRWKLAWETAPQGKLTTRLHVELERGELSASDTPGVQKQLRGLLEALAGGAGFALPQ